MNASAQDETGDMPETGLASILVLVDFSPATEKILAIAVRMARCFEARLCLLHIEPPEPDFVGYDPGPQVVRDTLADEWRGEHRRLQALGEELRKEGIDVLTLQIRKNLVEAVVAESRSLRARMVIAGFSHHGVLHRLLHGDPVRAITERLDCPILLVPEDEQRS